MKKTSKKTSEDNISKEKTLELSENIRDHYREIRTDFYSMTIPELIEFYEYTNFGSDVIEKFDMVDPVTYPYLYRGVVRSIDADNRNEERQFCFALDIDFFNDDREIIIPFEVWKWIFQVNSKYSVIFKFDLEHSEALVKIFIISRKKRVFLKAPISILFFLCQDIHKDFNNKISYYKHQFRDMWLRFLPGFYRERLKYIKSAQNNYDFIQDILPVMLIQPSDFENLATSHPFSGCIKNWIEELFILRTYSEEEFKMIKDTGTDFLVLDENFPNFIPFAHVANQVRELNEIKKAKPQWYRETENYNKISALIENYHMNAELIEESAKINLSLRSKEHKGRYMIFYPIQMYDMNLIRWSNWINSDSHIEFDKIAGNSFYINKQRFSQIRNLKVPDLYQMAYKKYPASWKELEENSFILDHRFEELPYPYRTLGNDVGSWNVVPLPEHIDEPFKDLKEIPENRISGSYCDDYSDYLNIDHSGYNLIYEFGEFFKKKFGYILQVECPYLNNVYLFSYKKSLNNSEKYYICVRDRTRLNRTQFNSDLVRIFYFSTPDYLDKYVKYYEMCRKKNIINFDASTISSCLKETLVLYQWQRTLLETMKQLRQYGLKCDLIYLDILNNQLFQKNFEKKSLSAEGPQYNYNEETGEYEEIEIDSEEDETNKLSKQFVKAGYRVPAYIQELFFNKWKDENPKKYEKLIDDLEEEGKYDDFSEESDNESEESDYDNEESDYESEESDYDNEESDYQNSASVFAIEDSKKKKKSSKTKAKSPSAAKYDLNFIYDYHDLNNDDKFIANFLNTSLYNKKRMSSAKNIFEIYKPSISTEFDLSEYNSVNTVLNSTYLTKYPPIVSVKNFYNSSSQNLKKITKLNCEIYLIWVFYDSRFYKMIDGSKSLRGTFTKLIDDAKKRNQELKFYITPYSIEPIKSLLSDTFGNGISEIDEKKLSEISKKTGLSLNLIFYLLKEELKDTYQDFFQNKILMKADDFIKQNGNELAIFKNYNDKFREFFDEMQKNPEKFDAPTNEQGDINQEKYFLQIYDKFQLQTPLKNLISIIRGRILKNPKMAKEVNNYYLTYEFLALSGLFNFENVEPELDIINRSREDLIHQNWAFINNREISITAPFRIKKSKFKPIVPEIGELNAKLIFAHRINIINELLKKNGSDYVLNIMNNETKLKNDLSFFVKYDDQEEKTRIVLPMIFEHILNLGGMFRLFSKYVCSNLKSSENLTENGSDSGSLEYIGLPSVNNSLDNFYFLMELQWLISFHHKVQGDVNAKSVEKRVQTLKSLFVPFSLVEDFNEIFRKIKYTPKPPVKGVKKNTSDPVINNFDELIKFEILPDINHLLKKARASIDGIIAPKILASSGNLTKKERGSLIFPKLSDEFTIIKSLDITDLDNLKQLSFLLSFDLETALSILPSKNKKTAYKIFSDLANKISIWIDFQDTNYVPDYLISNFLDEIPKKIRNFKTKIKKGEEKEKKLTKELKQMSNELSKIKTERKKSAGKQKITKKETKLEEDLEEKKKEFNDLQEKLEEFRKSLISYRDSYAILRNKTFKQECLLLHFYRTHYIKTNDLFKTKKKTKKRIFDVFLEENSPIDITEDVFSYENTPIEIAEDNMGGKCKLDISFPDSVKCEIADYIKKNQEKKNLIESVINRIKHRFLEYTIHNSLELNRANIYNKIVNDKELNKDVKTSINDYEKKSIGAVNSIISTSNKMFEEVNKSFNEINERDKLVHEGLSKSNSFEIMRFITQGKFYSEKLIDWKHPNNLRRSVKSLRNRYDKKKVDAHTIIGEKYNRLYYRKMLSVFNRKIFKELERNKLISSNKSGSLAEISEDEKELRFIFKFLTKNELTPLLIFKEYVENLQAVFQSKYDKIMEIVSSINEISDSPEKNSLEKESPLSALEPKPPEDPIEESDALNDDLFIKKYKIISKTPEIDEKTDLDDNIINLRILKWIFLKHSQEYSALIREKSKKEKTIEFLKKISIKSLQMIFLFEKEITDSKKFEKEITDFKKSIYPTKSNPIDLQNFLNIPIIYPSKNLKKQLNYQLSAIMKESNRKEFIKSKFTITDYSSYKEVLFLFMDIKVVLRLINKNLQEIDQIYSDYFESFKLEKDAKISCELLAKNSCQADLNIYKEKFAALINDKNLADLEISLPDKKKMHPTRLSYEHEALGLIKQNSIISSEIHKQIKEINENKELSKEEKQKLKKDLKIEFSLNFHAVPDKEQNPKLEKFIDQFDKEKLLKQYKTIWKNNYLDIRPLVFSEENYQYSDLQKKKKKIRSFDEIDELKDIKKRLKAVMKKLKEIREIELPVFKLKALINPNFSKKFNNHQIMKTFEEIHEKILGLFDSLKSNHNIDMGKNVKKAVFLPKDKKKDIIQKIKVYAGEADQEIKFYKEMFQDERNYLFMRKRNLKNKKIAIEEENKRQKKKRETSEKLLHQKRQILNDIFKEDDFVKFRAYFSGLLDKSDTVLTDPEGKDIRPILAKIKLSPNLIKKIERGANISSIQILNPDYPCRLIPVNIHLKGSASIKYPTPKFLKDSESNAAKILTEIKSHIQPKQNNFYIGLDDNRLASLFTFAFSIINKDDLEICKKKNKSKEDILKSLNSFIEITESNDSEDSKSAESKKIVINIFQMQEIILACAGMRSLNQKEKEIIAKIKGINVKNVLHPYFEKLKDSISDIKIPTFSEPDNPILKKKPEFSDYLMAYVRYNAIKRQHLRAHVAGLSRLNKKKLKNLKEKNKLDLSNDDHRLIFHRKTDKYNYYEKMNSLRDAIRNYLLRATALAIYLFEPKGFYHEKLNFQEGGQRGFLALISQGMFSNFGEFSGILIKWFKDLKNDKKDAYIPDFKGVVAQFTSKYSFSLIYSKGVPQELAVVDRSGSADYSSVFHPYLVENNRGGDKTKDITYSLKVDREIIESHNESGGNINLRGYKSEKKKETESSPPV